jgi:hypothetical protein
MKRAKITEIRLLPPMAMARLGGPCDPCNNYDLVIADDEPLGFRKIVPAPTLVVDESTGKIVRSTTEPVTFKDDHGRIRPVAPFLELWGRTGSDGEWVHLTEDMLGDAGLRWRVRVANIKAFRRTQDPHDRIEADSGWFSDHKRHELRGMAVNFLPNKYIPFGHIQFIKPTADFPEIRARFTPAHGYVYGSSTFVTDAQGNYPYDPAYPNAGFFQLDVNLRDVVYDKSKGKWLGYSETYPPYTPFSPEMTVPAQIFYGNSSGSMNQTLVSAGYLDDECDGIVEVALTDGKRELSAFAHVSAGPPTFAPDSYPIRTIYDELEQALLGPDIAPGDYTPEELQVEVEEIIRRVFENVRHQNTASLNGNTKEDVELFNSLVAMDRGDGGRAIEPIMAQTIVDNLAVRTLHQNVFTTLRSSVPPWFVSVVRRFDEIGDLTDTGRRKMPAMMRNADGRYLCLTRRQREKIRLASKAPFARTVQAKVTPKNETAKQLLHRAKGSPPSTLPNSAISNCYPGLECDFRNVWRRIFVGIVLHEACSYVMDVEDEQYRSLLHCRILQVDGNDMTTILRGPREVGGPAVALTTPNNPDGAWFMEWSNSLSRVLAKAGSKVTCVFTAKPSDIERPPNWPETQTVELEIRQFFEPDSPLISRELLGPGDLTQSLCSPWQNDYRQCSCYYWASSRPDYVDIVDGTDGLSAGYNWMNYSRDPNAPAEKRVYLVDTAPSQPNPTWITYANLFQDWQGWLKFIIGGKDSE